MAVVASLEDLLAIVRAVTRSRTPNEAYSPPDCCGHAVGTLAVWRQPLVA
jgi:hypothetical protein